MQYTWKIHSLGKRTINNVDSVVFNVVWEKFGITDDGYSGSVREGTNFNIRNIDFTSIIPYEQLSEENVIDWIKNTVNQSAIDKRIEAEIEKAKAHSVQVNDWELPWIIREE